MAPFEGSDNKAVISKQWDFPIIQKWYTKLGRPLSYFGLPGPKIMDILAWREFIGACTAVERLRSSSTDRKEDLNIHRQLHSNVAKHDIQGFQLLRGQVEDIILQGVDIDKVPPRFSSKDNPLIAAFQYDLVNLDFLGGIGYRDKQGDSKRVRSLKKMLERQARTDFLFIMTLNVRDNIEDEFDRYLQGTGAASQELHDTLEWYRKECGAGMKEYKLKSVVPLFIRLEAEHWGFDCFCYPPIVYEGDGKAKMVHFVFEMRHTPVIFPAFSQQGEADVLNLAFLTVDETRLRILDKQHPRFEYSNCESQFSFLPSEEKARILKDIRA